MKKGKGAKEKEEEKKGEVKEWLNEVKETTKSTDKRVRDLARKEEKEEDRQQDSLLEKAAKIISERGREVAVEEAKEDGVNVKEEAGVVGAMTRIDSVDALIFKTVYGDLKWAKRVGYTVRKHETFLINDITYRHSSEGIYDGGTLVDGAKYVKWVEMKIPNDVINFVMRSPEYRLADFDSKGPRQMSELSSISEVKDIPGMSNAEIGILQTGGQGMAGIGYARTYNDAARRLLGERMYAMALATENLVRDIQLSQKLYIAKTKLGRLRINALERELGMPQMSASPIPEDKFKREGDNLVVESKMIDRVRPSGGGLVFYDQFAKKIAQRSLEAAYQKFSISPVKFTVPIRNLRNVGLRTAADHKIFDELNAVDALHCFEILAQFIRGGRGSVVEMIVPERADLVDVLAYVIWRSVTPMGIYEDVNTVLYNVLGAYGMTPSAQELAIYLAGGANAPMPEGTPRMQALIRWEKGMRRRKAVGSTWIPGIQGIFVDDLRGHMLIPESFRNKANGLNALVKSARDMSKVEINESTKGIIDNIRGGINAAFGAVSNMKAFITDNFKSSIAYMLLATAYRFKRGQTLCAQRGVVYDSLPRVKWELRRFASMTLGIGEGAEMTSGGIAMARNAILVPRAVSAKMYTENTGLMPLGMSVFVGAKYALDQMYARSTDEEKQLRTQEKDIMILRELMSKVFDIGEFKIEKAYEDIVNSQIVTRARNVRDLNNLFNKKYSMYPRFVSSDLWIYGSNSERRNYQGGDVVLTQSDVINVVPVPLLSYINWGMPSMRYLAHNEVVRAAGNRIPNTLVYKSVPSGRKLVVQSRVVWRSKVMSSENKVINEGVLDAEHEGGLSIESGGGEARLKVVIATAYYQSGKEIPNTSIVHVAPTRPVIEYVQYTAAAGVQGVDLQAGNMAATDTVAGGAMASILSTSGVQADMAKYIKVFIPKIRVQEPVLKTATVAIASTV
jgi:hypothetical protein